MVLDTMSALIDGDPTFEHIREKILAFRPGWITSQEAMEMIRESSIIAVGERICRALHSESPETLSVFLDELAGALIEAGKPEIITPEDTIQVIRKQSREKFIASMVDGSKKERLKRV
ncbi:MAG: hypothetical protein HGB12_10125 [Bacteroidetes bacterium]|nr:hypothetical protein [Bacteroidota bacterium]